MQGWYARMFVERRWPLKRNDTITLNIASGLRRACAWVLVWAIVFGSVSLQAHAHSQWASEPTINAADTSPSHPEQGGPDEQWCHCAQHFNAVISVLPPLELPPTASTLVDDLAVTGISAFVRLPRRPPRP